MPFLFNKTTINDVILVEPKIFPDDRGFFMEAFKESDFVTNGINGHFVQDNQSKSTRGVLRGLHYQMPPFAQGKLIRCLKGAIYDVAVDIRKSSPTFGKWISYELSEDNRHMLWIPVGFAHGFLTLTANAEIAYKVSGGEYHAASERNIIWNDPDINIKWPFTNDIILAEKDAQAPFLKEAEVFE